MNAFLGLVLTLLALFTLPACGGDRSNSGEEMQMPETYEERADAATVDPDKGEDSRHDMERAENRLREAGDSLKDMARSGKDVVEEVLPNGR